MIVTFNIKLRQHRVDARTEPLQGQQATSRECKAARKGALIYRYQKLDSPTAEAHFKGALIYKVANRTSQNGVSHHVNKCLWRCVAVADLEKR
jgi:hypothetical protein